MARTGWGRHTVVATGSNDATKQVSVNAWNDDLDTDGILGFAAETISSASSITPTNSFVKLSGSTSIDTIAIANSSEGDLLYVITTGSVTLNNTSSPSSSGDIRLLADDDKDLSTTVPTILMRISDYWYEYGGGTVSDGSVTNAKLADMAANTIKVRNANSSGVPSDIALATTQILIGDGTGFTAASLSGDVTMDNTGDVTVGTLNQSTTGNAATATTATNATNIITTDDSSDTSCNVVFVNDAAATQGAKTGTNLTFNASSGVLTATGFAGPLTGNVTGDASGSSGSCTGNAATVTTNANLTGDVTSSGNATTIATDAVDIAMLSATGTASGTTFLCGDNTWKVAGGDDTPWSVVHDFDTYYYDMEIQSKPSDPSADNARFYVKEIDSDNDGLFCLIRKNSEFVETQIV